MLKQAVIFYGIAVNNIPVDYEVHIILEDAMLDIRSFVKGFSKPSFCQVPV